MIEDYRIRMRTGRAEGTGNYETTKRGTRREITKFVERYETAAGVFLPDEWMKKALAAIEAEGEMSLLESIKEYCSRLPWLHKKKELEEYAVDCLCGRIYRYWDDFENTETIIWM